MKQNFKKYSSIYLRKFRKLIYNRYAGISYKQKQRDKIFKKQLFQLNLKYKKNDDDNDGEMLKCNCAEMVADRIKNRPMTDNPICPYWICPAHGYKKI